MAKKPHLRVVPPRRPVAVNPREWIGGRIPTSIPVGELGENIGPEVVMWVELPSGDVLRSQLVRPGENPGALSEVLLRIFEHPENETPGRVRVASDSDAALIRPVLPPSVPIRVAPTPELDEVVGELEKALRSGWMEASYFDDGRLTEATLAKLFRAARELFRRAPWKTAFDSHVLRLDVPEMGVDGACLSILGALGEALGFVLFDSLADYEAFTDATDAREIEEAMEEETPDFGAPWMVLTFEPASDIPEPMRREVKEHRWVLAGARAYPLFRNHSRDGSSGTLDEREALLMAVAADALAAFARVHPAAFTVFDSGTPGFPELAMHHHGDGLPACTVTFPFEPSVEFLHVPVGPRPANPTRPPQRNGGRPATSNSNGRATDTATPPGRNDPCPCGSGKKYKKCHASGDAEQHRIGSTTEWMHDLDRALVHQMARFAIEDFPLEWARLESDPSRPLPPLSLEPQWVCYHVAIQGRTIAEWFVDRVGKGLQPRERAWIQSQRESWLSVWEVLDVDPGRSLTLRDLLTGTERTVIEAGASQDLERRSVILGRVVDHDGLSLLCGLHPHPLAPLAAEGVVEAARRKLRLRRDVPPARLRDAGIGRTLLDAWDDACLGFHGSAPQVSDVFSKSSLRAMEDLNPPEGASSFESPQAVVLAFKERHYGDWENHSLPAFGGRTPKQMCATKQGRAAVVLLLKQMERQEESEPAETRYDFSALRRRLGLGE